MKRVLSIIMALCMAVSCMTCVAYAAEGTSTDYDDFKATSLWPLLKEAGYLVVNEEGLLESAIRTKTGGVQVVHLLKLLPEHLEIPSVVGAVSQIEVNHGLIRDPLGFSHGS